MAWRLHLSDRTIRWLDIVPGKPTILAAWTQSNRVSFLDLQTGMSKGERTIEPPGTDDRRSPAWQEFVKSLAAPNGVALPMVRTRQATIHLDTDGGTRLYQTAPNELYLEIDGKESKLETDGTAAFIAVAMDRALGLLAALDSAARLHLYQEHVRVGVFDTGLVVNEEFRPSLVIAYGGTALFLTDGQSVVLMDASGRVRKRLSLHFRMGAMNCSPDGRRFVISDFDANVVRIYDGSLLPTHQRFAVDLLTEAKRSQLLASSASTSEALGPLAINNNGALAFAVSGTVCVTSLARMKAVPKIS
jgi:hypothetical protein